MQTDLGRLLGIWERIKRKRKQNTEFVGCVRRCTVSGKHPRGERKQNNKVFKVTNITVITDDCRIFFERTADAERIYNTFSQQIPT